MTDQNFAQHKNPSKYSTAAWSLCGCLLAVGFHWSITDWLSIDFHPGYFLPLLTGWLASRLGKPVVIALLVFGVVAAVRYGIGVGSISLNFSFYTEEYLVSVLTAAAFCRDPLGAKLAALLRPRWRIGIWCGLGVLALLAFMNLEWRLEIGKYLYLAFELGVLGLFLALVTIVRWRELLVRWMGLLRTSVHSVVGLLFAMAATGIILMASIVFATSELLSEALQFGVRIGISSGWPWLTALCFGITAFRLLDWRLLVGVVSLLFAVEFAIFNYLVSIEYQPFLESPSDGSVVFGFTFYKLPNLYILVNALSASLFGAMISPYWLSHNPETLQHRRSPLILAAIMVLQFVALPAFSQEEAGGSDLLVLAGSVFVSTLLWGRKAFLAAPVFILLCYTMLILIFGEAGSYYVAGYMREFGLLAIPFAFAGLLAQGIRSSTEGTNSTVDVTAIATIVRSLDASATMKAFVAVLAPLFVLTNIAGIVAFVWAYFSLEFNSLASDESSFIDLFWTWVVVGLVVGLAPLGFIALDWVARQRAGRYLAVVSGAALGLFGLGVAALLVSALPVALDEFGYDEFEGATGWIPLGIIGLIQVVICARLLSDSRIARLGLATLVGGALASGVVIFVIYLYLLGDSAADRPTVEEIIVLVIELLVFAVVIPWLIIRGVRLRLALSRDCPRALLLGDLSRGGFWVRLAFLTGLPSLLWNRKSTLAMPFWLFVMARPLVYLGFVIAAGKVEQLGIIGSLATGSVLIVGGHLTFVAAKRLSARKPWLPSEAANSEAPILFLRSFEDDQLEFRRPWWGLLGRWLDLWSFRSNVDQAMVDEIAQYGPIVALGRPGESQVPFGAFRHYASHEEWKTVVVETARKARAIVVAAGDSPGILWEYDLLEREGLVDRALLLFAPGEANSTSNLRALAAFPESGRRGVSVAEDGNHMVALLQTESGPTLLTSRVPTAASYIVAIRAHFQGRSAHDMIDPLPS